MSQTQSKQGRYADESEPIHLWFSLTYANYLVMPRSVLQSMPREWQAKFCELLDEARETFPNLDWPHYRCLAVDRSTGRFIKDPIPHYNRGRTRLASAEDLRSAREADEALAAGRTRPMSDVLAEMADKED